MCDCITKVNEHLATKNAKLGVGFGLSDNTMVLRLLLKVEKLDANKRGRSLPAVSCTFCPFCGEPASKRDEAESKAARDRGVSHG